MKNDTSLVAKTMPTQRLSNFENFTQSRKKKKKRRRKENTTYHVRKKNIVTIESIIK